VNAFNTAVFRVVLLAVGPDVLPEAIEVGDLPRWMSWKVRQKYRPVLVLELAFRARPHRSRSQGSSYHGKTEVTITSYGLHDDELSALRQAVEQCAVQETIELGVGEAVEGLDDLVQHIEWLVHPRPNPASNRLPQDVNPFSILLSLSKSGLRRLFGAQASVDVHGL
jgi:hypothetical protein